MPETKTFNQILPKIKERYVCAETFEELTHSFKNLRLTPSNQHIWDLLYSIDFNNYLVVIGDACPMFSKSHSWISLIKKSEVVNFYNKIFTKLIPKIKNMEATLGKVDSLTLDLSSGKRKSILHCLNIVFSNNFQKINSLTFKNSSHIRFNKNSLEPYITWNTTALNQSWLNFDQNNCALKINFSNYDISGPRYFFTPAKFYIKTSFLHLFLSPLDDFKYSFFFNQPWCLKSFNLELLEQLHNIINEQIFNNYFETFPFLKYEQPQNQAKMILFMNYIFKKFNHKIPCKKVFHDKNSLKKLFLPPEYQINFNRLTTEQILTIILTYYNHKHNNTINFMSLVEDIKRNKISFDFNYNVEHIFPFQTHLERDYTIQKFLWIRLLPKLQNYLNWDIFCLAAHGYEIDYKFLRRIDKASKDELDRIHDRLVEEKNNHEVSSIELINFNAPPKDLATTSNDIIKFERIKNSRDLFLFGKKMHNCVYTRLNNVLKHRSLIYTVIWKNNDYCLEVSLKGDDIVKIYELKGVCNCAPEPELEKIINNHIKTLK